MTASELNALMSKVTRDAWPQHLTLRDLRWTDNGIIIRNANALLMCEASVIRWLVKRHETVFYQCSVTGIHYVSQNIKEWEGPTLIEALVSACVAVGGGA